MSRAQEQLRSMPLCTTVLIAVNVAVHGLIFITSTNPAVFAISAYPVIYGSQYYRIFTAAFTHGGILHILMNMMSLLQLGTLLEKSFGTILFLILSLWSVVLCGVLYVLFNWLISFAFSNSQSYLFSSAVGYSGVLFSYALISSYHTTAPTQSVFGLFNVPSKLYPWILLGAMQVILPNISMLGHLSGIIVGLLAVYGPMDMFLMPSKEFCKSVDETNSCCGLTSLSNYCLTTDVRLTTDSCAAGSGSGGCYRTAAAIFNGISFVLMIIWNVVATVLHIIGCPASVTTPTCFSNICGKLRSFFASSNRDSYNEMSSDHTAISTQPNLRPMPTSDIRSLRSHRLGGNQAYERVNVDDNDETDLENGKVDEELKDNSLKDGKAAKMPQINL